MSEALENLKAHQQQLDADGCMVGVSRQALEETFGMITALQAENAKLRTVAEAAKSFAYEDRTLEKPEWWRLEELRRALAEAGCDI